MSFSHCLPAGKIKRWVFLTGPKSLLSSPLTVPMATSSSGAADGGCRPTSSTWPQGPAWSSELGCAVVTARADRLKMAHYSLQHYTELFWLIRTYTSVTQCCAGTLGPQDVLAIKVSSADLSCLLQILSWSPQFLILTLKQGSVKTHGEAARWQ